MKRSGLLFVLALTSGAFAASPVGRSGTLRMETAGGYAYTTPSASLEHAFVLTRGRIALQLGLNEFVSTRWAVDAVRSAPATGYIGVDGESILPRIQVAEVATRWPSARLRLTMGVVERPWSAQGNADWGLRPVAPTLIEREGWLEAADLGGTLTWTLPDGMGALWTAFLSGEGYRRRERNEDKSMVLGARLTPLAALDPQLHDALVLGVLVQRGRFGVSEARQHRTAFRLTGGLEWLRGGLEYTVVEGVDGDAAPEPTGLGFWVRVMPYGPLLTYARLDWVQELPTVDESQRWIVDTGLGIRLHEAAAGERAYFLIGYTRQEAGQQALGIAGASGVAKVDTILIQLSVDTHQRWGDTR